MSENVPLRRDRRRQIIIANAMISNTSKTKTTVIIITVGDFSLDCNCLASSGMRTKREEVYGIS